MTILITGMAGYLGYHIANTLLNCGYDSFIGIDNLQTGLISNAISAFHVADIRDKESFKHVFKEHRIDTVIHLASIDYAEDDLEYHETNVEGTKNLLEVMIEHGCDNLIYASTAKIYQSLSTLMPEISPVQCLSNHEKSKYAAEEEIYKCHHETGLNAVIFRHYDLVGYDRNFDSYKWNDKPQMQQELLKCMLYGNAFNIYGYRYSYSKLRKNPEDRTYIRDYLDVRDAAQAYVKAYEFLKTKSKGVHLFNIGTNAGTSVLEFLQAFEIANQVKIPYKLLEPKLGETSSLVLDSTKANELLNWQPKYSLTESLRVL